MEQKSKEEREYYSYLHAANQALQAGQYVSVEEVQVEVGEIHDARKGIKIVTRSIPEANAQKFVDKVKAELSKFETLSLRYASKTKTNGSGLTQVTLYVRSKNLL
jgi:hypothetical protein